MSLVTWQDLCVDAVDVGLQSRFWAEVSGLAVADSTPPARLDGPTPRHTRSGSTRSTGRTGQEPRPPRRGLRLGRRPDRAGRPRRCARVGDRPRLEREGPEGNELLCVRAATRPGAAVPIHGIGVDCADPEAPARWWGELFGVEPTHEPADDWWTLTGVAADERMTLDFAPVPEPRTVPNRVHWDVVGRVDDLLSRGATYLLGAPRWTVLADPEGNEFCVFPPA